MHEPAMLRQMQLLPDAVDQVVDHFNRMRPLRQRVFLRRTHCECRVFFFTPCLRTLMYLCSVQGVVRKVSRKRTRILEEVLSVVKYRLLEEVLIVLFSLHTSVRSNCLGGGDV